MGSFLYFLLLLFAICNGRYNSKYDLKRMRMYRRFRRKAALLGLVRRETFERARRKQLCIEKRNCKLRKQQSDIQNAMGDLIFHSVAMSPPMDITDPKDKDNSVYEKMISKFPAFIQGDVGHLRRRLLMETNKQKAYKQEAMKSANIPPAVS